MQKAFDQFTDSVKYVRELDALYLHLKDTLHLPNDLTDLLRAEWVYVISAMDKLIHEIIRIGMLDSFCDRRAKTAKFLAFTISIDTHSNIQLGPIPPPEYWFEQELVLKQKALSFQDPDKIADGLSLIWEEGHKWQKISANVGMPEKDLKTKLKTIVARRNQIVHEADLDLVTGDRNTIEKADIDDVVNFIELISKEIFVLVK